ncbi:hypothetical protein [Wolbachia endosymbiont (group A) of Agelastica alni]|uniref:hypothetical protein n=1 Tax=Wolbachia endosymbiont (group A) of Agelastica alni TaxID=3066130 RepID=UPI0031331A4A
MGKYTNAWFYKKTDPNHHDCANDGTCGQSIQNCKIGNTDISFFDSNKNLIAKVPKLPKYSSDKYGHQLYKEAESKQFNYFSTNIHDVLPNSFIAKYGYIHCTIKYDNLSQQERSQIETDIKTAYEAFKEKFCLKNSNASYDITVYIFNNRSDYTKYNDLLGIDEDGSPGYITRGVTDSQNILTYKQSAMDFVLGHELGHIFQLRFSPSATVKALYNLDTELIANVVGREVEEKNYKAICKQMVVDEYKNRGSEFIFKYKGTTGSIYRKDLSEAEKFQIIQRVKNSGLDEYEDRGSMFKFKYKDTTSSIYLKDLSEAEKFQIIQRVKNSGLDEYEDRGWIFSFKYKGTTYNVRYKDFSEDEKFKAIQNVKNIHELVDEYKDHGWIFSFKYKGTTYNVRCKDFSEEEKFQFIKDIKNSHESLVSECDGLGNENTVLSIHVDENKEISQMYFHNPDKNMSEWLDKTLISRSKPEEEVDDTAGKEPEPESAEEDTQQPSNFLSNIFSTIKFIIGSISSLFSWLFGSKEEEQSDNNLSLLNLSEEQSDDNLSLLKPDVNHDAEENYVGNYSLCNHDYHQHDDLI